MAVILWILHLGVWAFEAAFFLTLTAYANLTWTACRIARRAPRNARRAKALAVARARLVCAAVRTPQPAPVHASVTATAVERRPTGAEADFGVTGDVLTAPLPAPDRTPENCPYPDAFPDPEPSRAGEPEAPGMPPEPEIAELAVDVVRAAIRIARAAAEGRF